MASGRDGPGGADDGGDPKRRRPQPPILDLKASSVTVEPAADPAPRGAEDPAERGQASPQPGSEPGPEATPAAEAPGAGATEASAAQASATETGASEASTTEPSNTEPSNTETGPSADPTMADEGAQAAETGGTADAAPASTPPEDTATAAPPPPETSRPPWIPLNRRRIAAYALAAGAGAGAGALALMLTAWLFGIPIGDDGRLDAQAGRIAALEAQVRDLAAKPPPPPDERVDGLTRRVTAGERALDQLRGLETRIAGAEAALAKLPAEIGEAQGAALADLRRRLDEVAAAAAAAREAAPAAPGDAPAAPAGPALDALNARIAALETGAESLSAAIAAAAAKPADPDRAARLAAAAVALRAAVESGAPFAAELAALRGLAPKDERTAVLEPFAMAGLPDAATLRQELRAAIASAPRPAEPAAAPAPEAAPGLSDRLQAMLARLVRVRPVDAPAETAGAYAALQASAERGDLAAATADIRELPAPLAAHFAAFVTRVEGRERALTTTRDLARESLAGLAAPQGRPAPQ